MSVRISYFVLVSTLAFRVSDWVFRGSNMAGATVLAVIVACPTIARAVDVPPLVEAVNAVGPHGAGHPAAIAALKQLGQADAAQIPEILVGMAGANRLSANWLRAVVEALAQRELERGGRLPQAELEAFLADSSHSPQARSLAYDLILRVDPAAKPRLAPALLQDPSPELRRDGVAFALDEARQRRQVASPAAAIDAYRRALSAARDLDQIDEAAKELRNLGETVDVAAHFGFVMRWQLIGPFENTGESGYDVTYGPEQDMEPAREYPGKTGVVTWIDHTTQDEYGMVDLNAVLGKHKGAIAYARAEFLVDEARDAELRLGCITANKIWLNGELLTANHVYHAGTYIDQYLGRGRLRAGRNIILLKIAQNEQTESWAQNWRFQLRVCDQYGTGILSQDRRP